MPPYVYNFLRGSYTKIFLNLWTRLGVNKFENKAGLFLKINIFFSNLAFYRNLHYFLPLHTRLQIPWSGFCFFIFKSIYQMVYTGWSMIKVLNLPRINPLEKTRFSLYPMKAKAIEFDNINKKCIYIYKLL